MMRGVGHVPMTDNPRFVAKMLLRGSAPAATVAPLTALDAARSPQPPPSPEARKPSPERQATARRHPTLGRDDNSQVPGRRNASTRCGVTLLNIGIVLLLIVIEGVFVAAEIALVSLRESQIRALAENGRARRGAWPS